MSFEKIDFKSGKMSKQRILLVSKFLYPRGGDCIHVLNLKQLLEAHGHEVAVFAMHYSANISSPWESYFAKEVDFATGSKFAAVARIFGGAGVKAAFSRILSDFKPDVVHLHNIHSYLSPVVAQLAKKSGAKVIWTLHDYKLLCPSYSCLRQGNTCELCFSDKTQVLRKRCMKGSLVASALAYFEALRWNRKVLEGSTDAFICPSAFMAQKMREGGFMPQKIKSLCNFIATNYKEEVLENVSEEEAYAYVGRLSLEKGVYTLLKVAASLPYTLYVAGDGPLAECFHEEFKNSPQIHFLGNQNSDEVKTLLRKVKFSVVPSEWYENNPLSVIESLSMGTPVLGARIGGIPELISENVTGITFESGNEKELKEKIIFTMNNRFLERDLIRAQSLARFDSEHYYDELLKIYDGK